jgi:hypothetical protein
MEQLWNDNWQKKSKEPLRIPHSSFEIFRCKSHIIETVSNKIFFFCLVVPCAQYCEITYSLE